MAKKKNDGKEIAAEWCDLEILKPWADNPRKNEHAVDDVKNSIERFGFGAPILARAQDKTIIAGHTRFKAAQELGLDVVPVRFLNLSEADARALALADNKISELADWDEKKLQKILEQLDQESFDCAGLGFTDQEIENLLIDDEEVTTKTEHDLTEGRCETCGQPISLALNGE
tara:strand:+ start:263 stop:781 length:519 start_codon:yes stop_codon:yes gene_type:complete